jgi:predicted extracellular nuclease
MLHGNVSRLAVASFLVLITACPLDAGEGTTTTTDGTDDSTGPDPSTVTLTSASTSPSTSATTTTEPTTATEPTTMTATEASDTDTTAGTDPDTGGTDEEGSSSTGTIEGTPVTIPEIQMGDVAEDTAVEVTDAICTAVASNGFFMQDVAGGEWSGIWVFTGNGGPFPALGDVVTVVGVYDEFFDLSQIGTTGGGSVTITESPGEANVPAPAAIAVTDVSENWESVLVRISGDTFTVEEISDVMNVNEFRVEDGGANSVWVDDFIYDVIDAGDFAGFGVGASFDAIQGPLNFSFMEFKIVPRTMDDLSGYAAP